MKNITSLLLSLFLCASLSGQATDTNASRQTLEEISVQDIPESLLKFSPSAQISGGNVETQNLGAISDLSGLTPNFFINSNGIQSYGDIISARGIGNTQLFGDPAVILYIDGVPAGNTATYSSALFDLESVEILKGSQGHRFGKNSPGGVINVKTRRPGEAHRSKLFASYGTFDTQNYRILADGPMSESASYYFGLNRSTSDGFADNSNALGNDSTWENWNGRLGFNWVTENGVDVGIGGTWEEFDLGAQPLVPRASSGNASYASFYARNSSLNERSAIESDSQYVTLGKETEWGRLSSVTTRSNWEIDPNVLDLSFSDSQLAGLAVFRPDLVSSSTITEERRNWTEDLSLASDPDEAFRWNVGLFYNSRKVNGKSTRMIPMPSDGNTSNIAGYQLYSSETSYSTRAKNYSVRGNVSKDVLEESTIEFGLRLDTSKQEMARSKANSYPFLNPPFQAAVPPTSLAETFDWMSANVGFLHPLSETLALSINSSVSSKPGGFSAYLDPGSGNSEKFVREKNWATDIGLSLQPSDQTGFSITAYLNKIDDHQFEMPIPLSTDYYVTNAEEATVKGLEIEGFFKLAEGFTFNAAYGLCDSEYDKFSDLTALVGKQLSFVPRSTLNLSLSYENESGLHGQLGTRTIGKTHYWNNTGTNNSDIQDTFTTLQANIGHKINGFEINVFGSNLTDEEYYSSLVSSLTGSPGVVGSPRVIGLSISREF
jgi:iron complex outermembrane recepter protein